MNVHIATAGEKSPVEAAFNFTDVLGSIDKLYIVTGEGFKDKFNDIDSKVETKVIEVNAFNFEAVINCLVGIYLSEKPNIGKNDKIFMNLTGGTNILSVASYVLSMFLGVECYYLLKEGPIILNLPKIYKELNEKDKDLIKMFDSTDKIHTNMRNVKRLNGLKSKGLIEFKSNVQKFEYEMGDEEKKIVSSAKSRYAYLTPEGKFFAGILKESKWII